MRYAGARTGVHDVSMAFYDVPSVDFLGPYAATGVGGDDETQLAVRDRTEHCFVLSCPVVSCLRVSSPGVASSSVASRDLPRSTQWRSCKSLGWPRSPKGNAKNRPVLATGCAGPAWTHPLYWQSARPLPLCPVRRLSVSVPSC